MKIYTRGGDSGETSMLGGERVPKNHPRIEAYGTLDELNSFIGLARALWTGSRIDQELEAIQSDLFEAGSRLASPVAPERFPGVSASRVEELETAIDAMESQLEPLRNFIMPAGSAGAAALHVARSVCRRAERLVVSLDELPIGDPILIYLNRLSDYLFVAARFANFSLGVADTPWMGSAAGKKSGNRPGS